jgi:hypothetical protein
MLLHSNRLETPHTLYGSKTRIGDLPGGFELLGRLNLKTWHATSLLPFLNEQSNFRESDFINDCNKDQEGTRSLA